MAVWKKQYPVDFTPDGDRTNTAISKHIEEIGRLYSLINMLRTNFTGAGFPDAPEVNQLYINASTQEARIYTTANDWRPLKTIAMKHSLDQHNVGVMADLQALVADKSIVFLGAVPSEIDSGKMLKVSPSGAVELANMPTDYVPKAHDYTKHTAGTMANLQTLVNDGFLVYLGTKPTGADSAKFVSVDSNGNYALTNPAAATDALNAPYEAVEEHGTIAIDTTIAASDGNIHTFTVGGNITLTLNPNCLTGFCRTLTLMITNGGAYTITWPASVKWDGGSAPTFTASGVDIVTLITVDAGTTWYGSANGVSYA